MKGGSEKNEQQTKKAFSTEEQRKDQAANFKKGAKERNKVSPANGIQTACVPQAMQKARCLNARSYDNEL